MIQHQTWTFSTAGWLFVYFFGVIKALRTVHKPTQEGNVKAIGSSGGACAAGLIFVPEQSIDEMVTFIGDCCDDCRSSLYNRFKVREYVRQAVARFCPENIGCRVAGKLEVSVTHLPTFRNIRWKDFNDKDEYMDAILASSCAVGIAGMPYWTKKYGLLVDGGFSDLQLVSAMLLGTKFCKFHNGKVISVCPFYWSRADIKPSRFVNPLWALFPPPRDKLLSLYTMGYNDTIQFLSQPQCAHHLSCGSPDGELHLSSATNSEDMADVSYDFELAEGFKISDGELTGTLQKLQDGCTYAHEKAQKSLETTKQKLGTLGPLIKSALKAAAWQLVYCEVVLVSYITVTLFWILPFMPHEQRTRHARTNWRRALSCWGGLLNCRFFLKMLPILGCKVDMHAQDPRFISSLQEISLLYRIFMYHL